MRVDTLTSIKVFRQVVESGSFVAAAERMDLSTAMVSKHVAYVEKRLGVRLLNRNSRTLSLTEPGSVYFERCKTILDDLEATELELGSLGTVPRGTVRVTCPAGSQGNASRICSPSSVSAIRRSWSMSRSKTGSSISWRKVTILPCAWRVRARLRPASLLGRYGQYPSSSRRHANI